MDKQWEIIIIKLITCFQIQVKVKMEDFVRLCEQNGQLFRTDCFWPSLSVYQCGLPHKIAVEFFQTFVICGIIRQQLLWTQELPKSKVREKRVDYLGNIARSYVGTSNIAK